MTQNQPQQAQYPGSYVQGWAFGGGLHPVLGQVKGIIFQTEQGLQHFIIPEADFKRMVLEAQAASTGIVVAK